MLQAQVTRTLRVTSFHSVSSRVSDLHGFFRDPSHRVVTRHGQHAVARSSRYQATVFAASSSSDAPTPLQPDAMDNPLAEIEAQTFHALIYRALHFTIGLLVLYQIASPSHFFERVYQVSVTPVIYGLSWLVSASNMLLAYTLAALSYAGGSDTLGSPVNLRLNLGLVAWAVVSLASLYKGPVHPSTAATVVHSTLATAIGTSGLYHYLLYSKIPLSEQPKKLGKSIVQGVIALKDFHTLNSLVYCTAATSAVALAATLWTAGLNVVKLSLLTVPVGPLGMTLLRHAAAGLVLASFVLFSLQEADKQKTLGSPIPKTLNLGVAMLGFYSLFAFYYWFHTGVLVLNTTGGPVDTIKTLAGTKIFACFTLGVLALYNYFKA